MSVQGVAGTSKKASTYSIRDVRAIDGDTIEATLDLGLGIYKEGVKIRLLGIDTPERGEEGFHDAWDYLTLRMILCEDSLLVTTGATGKYGRVLGIIMCGVEDVNQELLDKGLAEEWP